MRERQKKEAAISPFALLRACPNEGGRRRDPQDRPESPFQAMAGETSAYGEAAS